MKVYEEFNFALAVLYAIGNDEESQEVRELFAEAMKLILKANRLKRMEESK